MIRKTKYTLLPFVVKNNKLMGSLKSAHFYTIIFYLSRTLQPDFQLSFAIAH